MCSDVYLRHATKWCGFLLDSLWYDTQNKHHHPPWYHLDLKSIPIAMWLAVGLCVHIKHFPTNSCASNTRRHKDNDLFVEMLKIVVIMKKKMEMISLKYYRAWIMSNFIFSLEPCALENKFFFVFSLQRVKQMIRFSSFIGQTSNEMLLHGNTRLSPVKMRISCILSKCRFPFAY